MRPNFRPRIVLVALVSALSYGSLTAQCVDDELTKFTAFDGASGDAFGIPAIDGQHVLIGAPLQNNDTGAVYAYHFDGTNWIFDHKLTASQLQSGDIFGFPVAIDGDVAIVGGFGEGTGRPGMAWIFRRMGNVWTEEARLDSPTGQGGSEFGHSVDIEGDRAVVGARLADGQAPASGAAWVYERIGGSWQGQMIQASDGQTGDDFGLTIALSGDRIVVGAGGDDHSGGVDSGSAYVFEPNGGLWTERQKLIASDAAQEDEFGYVDIEGDLMVVGAVEADVGGMADVGAGYVFRFDGSRFSQEQKLTASDGLSGDYGGCVAISGETIVYGAAENDVSGSDSGAAYIFHHDGTRWLEVEKIIASDGQSGDSFGFPVAIAQNRILVGAPADERAVPGNGAAYLYGDDGLALSADQDVYVNGDTMTLKACGGLAGALSVIAVVSPQFVLTPTLIPFDADGRWTLVSPAVDPNWPRLTIGLQVIGIRAPGILALSDIEFVEIR